MGQLDGRVAIVTGGGTGMGAEVTQAFVREGATVAIVGRRKEKLDETAGRCPDGAVTVAPGDVTDEAFVERLVDDIAARHGRVDILVNNAGIHARPCRVHEVPVAEFDEFLAIDLRGPFLLIRAVLPHLLRQGGGSIVNIASIAGIVGLKYTVGYSAAKGGLVQMTRAVAVEYASEGIRVNCLCPGGISPTASRAHMSPEELALLEDGYRGNPSGRRATTTEMAETVLFLAGPNSAHITGAVIPTDGGYSAQ